MSQIALFEGGIDPPAQSPSPEPSRQAGTREKILQRLQQGPATNIQLMEIAIRYGARIHELKQPKHGGHRIDKDNLGNGVFQYTLSGTK